MEDYLISKRLKELLGTRRSFDNETNKLLFDEYMNDKARNIPPEDSMARTLLIIGNESIICFVLRKQFGIYGEYDNFEEFAEGKIGLIQAVDGYNTQSNVKFITYAYQAITHRVYKYYSVLNNSANLADKKKVSLNDYIAKESTEGKSICFEDNLMADDDFIERFSDKDFIEHVKKNIIYLTPNEQICVINSFGLFGNPCVPQSDIAKNLCKTQSSVSTYIKVATRKLRVLCCDESLLDKQDLKLRNTLLKYGPQNEFVKSFNFIMKNEHLDNNNIY